MLACFWKHTVGSGQVYQPLLPGAIQRFAGSQKLIQTLNNQLQQQMLPGANGVRHFWNPDPAVMFLSGWILYLSMPKPSKQLWAVFMSWFVTQGSLRSALTLHWHLNRQDPTSGPGGWSFREFGFTLAALGSAEGFCASPFAVVLWDLAGDKLWKFAFRRYSQPLSIQAQDPAKTWVKTCVENKAAWQGAQSQIMHIFVIKTWSLYFLLSLRTKFGSGPHGQVRNVFPQYYGNWPPIFDNFLHLDMQWPELPPQCPIHLPFVHLIQQPKESNDALRYALAVLANMHGLSCARHSSGASRRTVNCFHYWL